MSEIKYLSSLQIAVMRVLWTAGEATVAQVHTALLQERDLAFTTVATLLTRLEAAGMVTHRTEERRYIYRALITEGEARRSMIGDLTDRLFQGSATAMLQHLLREKDVSEDDIEVLKALIQAKEAELRSKDDDNTS